MKGRHIWLLLFGSYALGMQGAKALEMIREYSFATAAMIFIAWAIIINVLLADLTDWAAERRRAQLTKRFIQKTTERLK